MGTSTFCKKREEDPEMVVGPGGGGASLGSFPHPGSIHSLPLCRYRRKPKTAPSRLSQSKTLTVTGVAGSHVPLL